MPLARLKGTRAAFRNPHQHSMFEPSLLADYATPTTLAGLLFGALLGAAGIAFLSQLISRNRSWRAFFTFTIVSFTAFCLLVLGVVWFTPAPTGAILKAQVRSLYTPAADKGTQLSSMQNPSMLQALLVEWAVNRSTRSGPGEPTFAEVQRSKNLGSAAEIEAALPDPGTLQTKALLEQYKACQAGIKTLRDPMFIDEEVVAVWSMSQNPLVFAESTRLHSGWARLARCADLRNVSNGQQSR
jgi:hypothetical protein